MRELQERLEVLIVVLAMVRQEVSSRHRRVGDQCWEAKHQKAHQS